MTAVDIPGYELREVIGRGGMGRVHRAVDRQLGRTVAVKLLLDSDDAELASRFEIEARAVASLSHQNIAKLYEFGRTADGQPYCVMEFAAGGTLADHVGQTPLSWQLAAKLTRTLAMAVQHAHENGVLHRDLKPANVLIASVSNICDANGSPQQSIPQAGSKSSDRDDSGISNRELSVDDLRIADFGLARRLTDSRITRTGQVVGTPAYMAPEQASGMTRNPGPASDVYSLGAMLFEMLTGRPPFHGADSVETIMLLLGEDPPAPRSLQPSVPWDMQTICLKCLEKKPSRRYATAAALADDLERLLDGRPILARPTSAWEHVRKWAARNPWKAGAFGLFAVSGIGAMIGLAALQTAYADLKSVNGDLVTTNEKLVRANQQTLDARDLTRDALDRIVNRMRDELHELPQATGLMRATSRDSVELHRRLHQSQPDDLQLALAFVRSLSSHEHLEWLYGDIAVSATAAKELRSVLATQDLRTSNIVEWQVFRLNVLIDDALNSSRVQQLADQSGPEPLDAKALREQISRQLTRLVELYPDAPESWKTASRADQLTMTDAAEAGDLAGYLEAAHRRVDHSRKFQEAERDPQLKLEATLWLSQAQRVLATALRLSQQEEAAAQVLTAALDNCRLLSDSDQHRGLRFETAEVLTELATITANRNQVADARSQLTEALDLLVRLVHEYPDDAAYRIQFATALLRSAELSETQNEQANAREQLNTAAEQVRRALELSPGNSGAESLQSTISSVQVRMTP